MHYKPKIQKSDVIRYLEKQMVNNMTDKRKNVKVCKVRIELLKDLLWYFEENYI